MQTSVEDLLRWDSNFTSKAVGGEELHAFLHGLVPLADGTQSRYARGLIVDDFR